MAMPKTNGSNRLPYKVIRVGGSFPLRRLSLAEQNELRRIFNPHKLKLYKPQCKDHPDEDHPDGREPFFADYELCVQSYIQDVANVKETAPAKVKRRIDAVSKNAIALREAITDLEPTDLGLINSFFTTRFLMGEKVVGPNEIIGSLDLFLKDVAAALVALDQLQSKGRIPAFAEQALAAGIARAIYRETGKRPTQTRDGTYARVLKCALDHGAKGLEDKRTEKGRMDVQDLMRHGIEALDPE